jgi:hypothetical protein
MNIIAWIKKHISILRGDHIEEVMSDLRRHTMATQDRVDEIYRNRIQLDGEDNWLRREQCDDRK